jgi:GNAT superfamily N-acetyltransferase
VIRRCVQGDFETILEIVNDAAEAYRGVIPDDCFHEAYMPADQLAGEIADGVEFWGFEERGNLLGIMGIQDKGEVTLIRHAYVRTAARRGGIGTRLLEYLEGLTERPILIGTWAAAVWAISFYEKNGYTLLPREEGWRLLGKYWSIPRRQTETSVVLANRAWSQRNSGA